ncbi:MAG: carboxypeptidase regulatory-like domain-containing protein [Thiohalomonadaceae bacterium]
MKKVITAFIRVFLVVGIAFAAACGGGGGGGGGSSPDPRGTWKLVSWGGYDVSAVGIHLFVGEDLYTYDQPAALGEPACREFGRYTVSGSRLSTEPAPGSSCGSGPDEQPFSVRGEVLTLGAGDEAMVFARAEPRPIGDLRGDWQAMAAMHDGEFVSLAWVDTRLSLDDATYTLTATLLGITCTTQGNWALAGDNWLVITPKSDTCEDGPLAASSVTIARNGDLLVTDSGTGEEVWATSSGGSGGGGAGDGWGFFEGVVVNASNSSPLGGVAITATGGGKTYTFTTNASGTYWIQLPAGDYAVEYRLNGYVTALVPKVTVYTNGRTTGETVRLAPQGVATGTVQGSVRDALNGTGIEGATIHWRSGINVTVGDPVTTSTTGANGAYTVTLASGNYTGQVVVGGYTTTYFNIAVVAGVTVGAQHVVISPAVPEGQLRVVLTWGASPADLDAHVTGPCTGDADPESLAQRCHVYWNQTGSLDNIPYMQLDVDEREGYGPETITIDVNTAGTYRYSVHDYTNSESTSSTALSASGAQVRVYGASGLLATFPVPVGRTGNLWTVFELTNDTIVPINLITNEELSADVRTASFRGMAL